MLTEINFDGIVGPTHNYAGLSRGNIASASHAGEVSRPRAAALQGIAKMRHNLALGLPQGFFVPLDRPDTAWLAALGTAPDEAEPHLRAQAWSASAMWAANAATVSPAPDCADGRCHLTVANLVTMPHRSHEWPGTLAQLRLAFADSHFAVHAPIPAPFGDEGAANHMRLCSAHDAQGVEIFVYGGVGGSGGGGGGGRFPVRQHIEASRAVARRHGLDPARTLFLRQSDRAIAGGAFHNDVVAVANEHVLFTHESAFHDREAAHAEIRAAFPPVEIVEVPESAISLAEAVRSYLFNAQLVSLPGGAGMGLILPTEAQAVPAVRRWLEMMLAGQGPIRALFPVDVRQSMANGGGPACLRLRVAAEPAAVDARFMADDAKLDRIAAVVEARWPQAIVPDDLASPALLRDVRRARAALLEALDLHALP